MLMRRWDRAQQGDGQLMLIVGEPGIGKSRLIEEFHARLRETPHTWAEWSCSLLQNTPLQRFGGADVAAEQRLAELESTLTQIKLEPAENVPLLAPLLDIPLPQERAPALAPRGIAAPAGGSADGLGDGQRTGSAAGAGTRRCALGRPDHARCLRGIAERGALAPLFVLITARPEFRAPWSTRSHHSTISLSPLDRHQVRHMVGELAARHALPKEVVGGGTERTGGVPLFVSSSRT
jgi:predicted ATPase